MHSDSLSDSVVRFLARYYAEFLAILALLFVLQTGLVPFDLTTGGVGSAGGEWFSTAVDRLALPDIVSNIFLYIPIGALLFLCLLRGGRSRSPQSGRAASWLISVVMGATLSGTVEWLQAYSPSRVSSLIDLVSNILGTAVGATMLWVSGALLPRLLHAVMRECRARPHAGLLKVCGVLVVIGAATPFSFSFDVMRLNRSVKSAVWVPFACDESDQALRQNLHTNDEALMDAHLRWWHLKRWSRWAAECASFAVLGWLLQALLRGDYGFGRRGSLAMILWFGGMFAAGLSFMQLLIISRACDVTDILFRVLGLWLGAIGHSAYLRDRRRLTPALQEQRHLRLAKIGCAAVFGYILFTGVIPLSLDLETGGPATSFTSKGFLPFHAYFDARFDLMIDDAMEKFGSYALLAMLLASGWPGLQRGTLCVRSGTRARLTTITAIGLTLCVVIEVIQMYIPVRITSLTDPILAGAGCVTGFVAQDQLALIVRSVIAGETPYSAAADERPRAATVTPRLTPADALIATLTEPHPDAPIEPELKPTAERLPHRQPQSR